MNIVGAHHLVVFVVNYVTMPNIAWPHSWVEGVSVTTGRSCVKSDVGVARVIADGEAGTWFIMGYVMYVIVGVVAMAVTSLFYFYIETVLGKAYAGAAKAFAWVHLVLGNIGVAGAAILAMVGGYLGGAGMQPTQFGGSG